MNTISLEDQVAHFLFPSQKERVLTSLRIYLQVVVAFKRLPACYFCKKLISPFTIWMPSRGNMFTYHNNSCYKSKLKELGELYSKHEAGYSK